MLRIPLTTAKMNGDTSGAKKVLVTGGAGYIGTHVVLELIEAGYSPVVIDNMVNSSAESMRRVSSISDREVPFHNVDLLDSEALDGVFKKYGFECVIHIAALKAVGESVQLPLLYYKNNMVGIVNLLNAMKAHGVKQLVFSSSATVYGTPNKLPVDETHPVGQGITNPYGTTKFFAEVILQDLAKAEPDWKIIILRYFNPVGAHISGRIGEDPRGIPNNLMPFIGQVAVGRRAELSVFGDDYDTPDGTGVRDYIHVVDLAQGHVSVIKEFEKDCGLKIYNLGTGKGVSVLDLITAFEKASGRTVKYKVTARREGDVASMYADPSFAQKELGWKAERGLQQMCEDTWRWMSKNPQGFATPEKTED